MLWRRRRYLALSWSYGEKKEGKINRRAERKPMKKTLGPHPQRNKKGGHGKEMKRNKADTISPKILTLKMLRPGPISSMTATRDWAAFPNLISTSFLPARTEIKWKRTYTGGGGKRVKVWSGGRKTKRTRSRTRWLWWIFVSASMTRSIYSNLSPWCQIVAWFFELLICSSSKLRSIRFIIFELLSLCLTNSALGPFFAWLFELCLLRLLAAWGFESRLLSLVRSNFFLRVIILPAAWKCVPHDDCTYLGCFVSAIITLESIRNFLKYSQRGQLRSTRFGFGTPEGSGVSFRVWLLFSQPDILHCMVRNVTSIVRDGASIVSDHTNVVSDAEIIIRDHMILS